MNLRNEIDSTVSLPADIGKLTLHERADSFSSLKDEVDPDSSPIYDFSPAPPLPFLGETIVDPVTNDTYLLNLVIGSSSNGHCRVYRALYSKCSVEDGSLIQSGEVTLKIINKNLHGNESEDLRIQGGSGISYTPDSNIIGSKRIFSTANLLCVALPFMSEGSLRFILSTRPDKKLPEDFIAVVFKEVLLGLRDELHVESNLRVHKTLNAGDIFVHIENNGQMLIKLAFEASVYDSENANVEENPNVETGSSSSFLDPKSISEWGAAPEVFGTDVNTVKSDIWLLGITALELAYGVLPVKNRGDLDCIIKKIREKKKLPKSLEKLLIVKKEAKMKKALDSVKRKKRVFSEEFEWVVLVCLRENPNNRPTADHLLNTSFFTTPIERFKRFVLIGNN